MSTGEQVRLTHNDLSNQLDRLTGRQVDKYEIPIMPCTPIYLPLDLSTLVDRLTGRKVDKYEIPLMPCTPIY